MEQLFLGVESAGSMPSGKKTWKGSRRYLEVFLSTLFALINDGICLIALFDERLD